MEKLHEGYSKAVKLVMGEAQRGSLQHIHGPVADLLKVPEEYVRCGVYHDVDRCAEETRALLALPQRPTCIIFPDDFSALGGYNALTEAGLSIPEDISVMGYDGIYLSRVVKPSLVTYQQNTKSLGRLAADKLIELIEHPRVTLPEQIRVSGKLLDGGSVRIL